MAHHRASHGEPSFQSADSTDESKDTVTIDIQTRPKQAAEPPTLKTYGTRVASFSCKHISFWYPPKATLPFTKNKQSVDNSKPAIDDVSCHFDSGSLVAVIGASGAGKSTLLDILARRFNKGRLEGEMFVNGKTISNENFKEIMGYVPQEDIFSATSTPFEALMFIANLKLGPGVPRSKKVAIVHSLAQDAGLAKKLHVRIGGTVQGGLRLKGMSGGEKRRLALVACAITNPSIMFLDEPTSGLDSYAALKIMEKASDWATRGRIVLCTIHQPRAAIWDLMDYALILGTGGHQVYFGPVDDVPAWFESLGYPVPSNVSVPDFVLDLLNNSFSTDRDKDRMERGMAKALSRGAASFKIHGRDVPVTLDMIKPGSSIASFAGSMADSRSKESFTLPTLIRGGSVHINTQESTVAYKESPLFKDMMNEIEETIADGQHEPTFVVPHANIWAIQAFPILLRRNGLNYLRNPGCLAARVIMVLIVAVLTGWSFRSVTDSGPSITTIDYLTYVNLTVYMLRVLASLFFTCITLTLLPFVSISLFLYDRQFYNKESRARLYNTGTYFLSNVLLEGLINAITGVIFGGICYVLMHYGQEAHLPDWDLTATWHLLRYLGLIVIVSNVGCLQAIMFSLLSPNADIAFVLNCGYTTISLLTSGFMVPPATLKSNSVVLASLQWISVTRYAFRALMAHEFDHVYFPGTRNINLPKPQPPVTAEYLLSSPTLQMGDLNFSEDTIALAAFGGAFTLVSFFALKHLYRD